MPTIEYLPFFWTATGSYCKTRKEAEEQLKSLKKRFEGWSLPANARGGIEEIAVYKIS